TFAHLPFTTFLSIVALLLIFTFLVTSADSATYILASMTAKGSLHPPLFTKVVWGALVSLVAAVLLFTGGLEALHTASLISALPFTVVLLLLLVAIVKLLNKEMPPLKKEELKRFKKMEKAVRKDEDRKSTRLNSSHVSISYAVFCLKKKTKTKRKRA